MGTYSEILDIRPLVNALQAATYLTAKERSSTLLYLGFWQSTRRRRQHTQALTRWMVANPPQEAIDPDDVLDDEILLMQQAIQALVRHIQAMPPSLSAWTRWLVRRIMKEQILLYQAIDAFRVWMLEHDADCSPVIDEALTTQDALLAALERDAA